jgi:hypothetical protein
MLPLKKNLTFHLTKVDASHANNRRKEWLH